MAKPGKSRLKALLVLTIIIVAALAGAYYYISLPRAPQLFTMYVGPSSFHAAAGGGVVLFIQVSRVSGFTGGINLTLDNPPSWVNIQPIAINSTSVNATLKVLLSQQAPKGSYQLTVHGTAQGSADQTVMVSMKVVGVSLVANANGSALVYETTKSLDPASIAALVSFVNGTFQFSKSTPQLDGLEPGDVIAESFNRTNVLPHGCLRTVLDVRKVNGAVFVDTRIASLIEAAQYILITNQASGATGGAGGTSTTSFGPKLHPGDTNAIDACNSLKVCKALYTPSLTLDGFPAPLGGTAKLTLGGTLGLYFGMDASIDSGGVHWVVMGLFGHEDLTASIVGTHGDKFTWHQDTPGNYITVNNGKNLYEKDIPILANIVNVYITVALAGRSSGTLVDDVNTGTHQSFDVIVGIYDNGGQAPSGFGANVPSCTKDGWNGCAWSNLTGFEPTTLTIIPAHSGESDTERVEIGPRLEVGIDGNIAVASIKGGGYGEVDLFWELDHQAKGFPRWSLYMGLTGQVGLDASAGFNYPSGGGCSLSSMSCWISTSYQSIFYFDQPYSFGDFARKLIKSAPNDPPPTPTLIIPDSADTISLESPAFLDPYMFSNWATLSGVEPEGEAVTCIWQTAELGQLGTSPAAAINSALVCHGPGGFPADQINQIISKGLTQLTVTVVAEDSAGKKSDPSNAITVHILLPTPVLQIQYPTPTTPITQNVPFSVFGSATLSVPMNTPGSSNGILNLCVTAPQRLQWSIDFAGVGGNPSGGCSGTLTISTTGQDLVEFYLLTPDLSNLATDNNGNFIIASIMVTVGQASQPPPPGTSGMSVAILTQTESSNSPPHTVTSNPTVQLQGSLTGGTAPYIVTWSGTWDGKTGIIAKGFPQVLSYSWQVCTNGPNTPWFGFSGTMTVTLSAIDSSKPQQSATAPNSIQINFNCVVIQAVPPMLPAGLVTLLTLIFTVTTERKTILKNRPWLRLVSASCPSEI